MASTATQGTTNALTYFPLDVGLFADDEKIFDLTDGATDDAAFADVARYIYLLARIYACEDGPALEVGPRMGRMLARRMGLTVEGFEGFVGRCADADLFDADLWARRRVLTSHGIQRRWKLAKKRSGMPQATLRWSLLGEEGGWVADECRAEPTNAEPTRAEPSAPDECRAEPSRPAKEKERKREGKEKGRKEDQSVCPSGLEEVFDNGGRSHADRDVVPACMGAEQAGGTLFADCAGRPHRTRYGALEETYRQRTGRSDFDGLMRRVCEACPGGCRASPDEVRECFELISDALERVDPGKGSPWALVRHVLAHDRGGRDAA